MGLEDTFAAFNEFHRDFRAMETELTSPAPLSLTLIGLHDRNTELVKLAGGLNGCLSEISAAVSWSDPVEFSRDVRHVAKLPTADANSPLTKWAMAANIRSIINSTSPPRHKPSAMRNAW